MNRPQNGKHKKRNKGKKATQKVVHAPPSVKRARQPRLERVVHETRTGLVPGLLGSIGGGLGSLIAGSTGGNWGRSLGDVLGKVTGLGAYKVSTNSLMTGNVPMFGGGAGTVISHREYVGDISGSTAFTLTSYPINPGLGSLFPWLSLCAAQFEEYELLGMLVEYKSTSAVALNSTNTALGTVVMATNYDTYDTLFSNKQQMEAYEFSTSAAPSQSMLHPIECKPKANVLGNKFVRLGNVPSGADQRFYDVGNFQLATVGMQAASVIGELWVTYHVRFHKPKLPTPVGGQIQAGWLNYSQSGPVSWNSGTLDPDNTILMVPSAGSMSIVTPNVIAGIWLVVVVGTGNVTSTTGISAGTGATLVATTAPFGTGVVSSFQTGTASASVAIVANTSPTWSLGLLQPTIGGGTFNARIYVTQMNNAVAASIDLPLKDRVRELHDLLLDLKSRLIDADEDDYFHREAVVNATPTDLESSIHLTKDELRKLIGR